MPRPFAAPALEMRVVDAETGRPLAGAVIVARWTWLTYYMGDFHGVSRLVDEGDVLHAGEAVTDADGRFMIDGFGPTIRTKGSLPKNTPSLTVFLPDYELFEKHIDGYDRSELRLKRRSGPTVEYAATIGTK